jgi:hypothetical protein
MLSHGSSPGARRARGQALVELAIILPIFLVLLAAALDLGRLFYSTVTLTNAAGEGAMGWRCIRPRVASQPPTGDQPGDVPGAPAGQQVLRLVEPADVSLSCNPSARLDSGTAAVTVQGPYSLLTRCWPRSPVARP